MQKYLFVATNEIWGGSEFLWTCAAEKLVSDGHEVRVSVSESNKAVSQVEHLRLAGCPIFYRRNIPPLFFRLGRKLVPSLNYDSIRFRKAAKGVDLVVISQGANFEGLPWMENARAAGTKYVAIAQSAVPYWWPNDVLAEKLGVNYEKACAAYFVSEANLELSRHQFGSSLPKAKVVRNPFNVRYEARPAWPDDSSGILALACVARLEVISKAQDLLLQVLNLAHWRQRNVRLTLVGKGPNERGLRRMVERLGLTNIEFAGHQDNIEETWSKHHALVLPSRFEGMPLSVVEAMLCGRPCIATDVGGNRELIRDGINGFLAKAPTVELLDETMNRAWESRARLKEIGCAAANDVRQFVSRDPAEDFARELEAVAGDGRETSV